MCSQCFVLRLCEIVQLRFGQSKLRHELPRRTVLLHSAETSPVLSGLEDFSEIYPDHYTTSSLVQSGAVGIVVTSSSETRALTQSPRLGSSTPPNLLTLLPRVELLK